MLPARNKRNHKKIVAVSEFHVERGLPEALHGVHARGRGPLPHVTGRLLVLHLLHVQSPVPVVVPLQNGPRALYLPQAYEDLMANSEVLKLYLYRDRDQNNRGQ